MKLDSDRVILRLGKSELIADRNIPNPYAFCSYQAIWEIQKEKEIYEDRIKSLLSDLEHIYLTSEDIDSSNYAKDILKIHGREV
ncbi:MAG: hypothetical protein ACK5X3_11105 [Pseudomonadota bacterium]|jgi:hypothetical protein